MPSKTFITDALASSDLPKSVGADATEGMRGTAPGSPDTGAAPEAFDKLYTDAAGPGRQTFDAHNFDAVILCYLAAVAAGSTEGPDMAKELADRLRARAATSTPGSSCRMRSRRSRTATTSTTKAPPARSTSTRTATPPRACTTCSATEDGKVEVFSEVPIEPPK